MHTDSSVLACTLTPLPPHPGNPTLESNAPYPGIGGILHRDPMYPTPKSDQDSGNATPNFNTKLLNFIAKLLKPGVSYPQLQGKLPPTSG
ncbi:hypothetical protein LCGC14_1471490 [marine sediment metagenome]|uniref:Uncharacterized protein n=1 Tax=marine sediment metagenome TaxID=412755 RepID=A0A0F9LSQ7_9ZZZZ